MPRIPLPTLESMTPEQRRVHDAIANGPRAGLRGPFLAAIHQPELADRWQQLGELLRYRTSLAPRLSELAILVTARQWDAQYEWHAHEPHALKGGLSTEVIEAIRTGAPPVFLNPDEAAVHDYCVELHEKHRVSEKNYARALGLLGTVGVVELTALLGYYTMVAMTLNAHEILPPEGVSPLPPRSRA